MDITNSNWIYRGFDDNDDGVTYFDMYWENTPSLTGLDRIPIHKKAFPFIDPQLSSPLYNGRIPAEVRMAIFDHCLMEYEQEPSIDDSNLNLPSRRYPKNTNYTRPGYEGKKSVNVALLRACRRVYLETYHLPVVKKEHVFWHIRGPPDHVGSSLTHAGTQEFRYFARFLPWQRSLIKDIHLFTQSFWLEDTFPEMAKREYMQGLEKVMITIRRGDWWWNERNHLLGISPQSGRGDAEAMLNEWARERSGKSIPWNQKGWGCAFKGLPNLKVIEMELETSDDKKDELKAIVDHAKTWEFPAYTNNDACEMVLRHDGRAPTWSSWDGPPCFWSHICPYCGCGQSKQCTLEDPPNKGCVDRLERTGKGIGPLCHVARLQWKIVKKVDCSHAGEY